MLFNRVQFPSSGPIAVEEPHLKDLSDGTSNSIQMIFPPVEYDDHLRFNEQTHPMPKKLPKDKQPSQTSAEQKAQWIAEQAVMFAQFAAQVLIVAEQFGIKSKPLNGLSLSQDQQNILLTIPDLTSSAKAKLMLGKSSFSIAEAAGMMMAVVENLPESDARQQLAALHLAKYLMDSLQAGVAEAASSVLDHGPPKSRTPTKGTVIQFKITLRGSKPPIWRRIQVEDCTLEKFHEHIQTAMGWTNSHLYSFEIDGEQYGDRKILEDLDCIDTKKTRLGHILPPSGVKFRFAYIYDFGNYWDHDVVFEGSSAKQPGQKYPLCVTGKRACPPEDIGNLGGYYDFLEALTDPQHERHEDYLEWGSDFDPAAFDAAETTQAMHEGLPGWSE